jgi:hypothetical protein
MRGSDQQQGHVFSYISPEQRAERSSAAGRNLDYLVFRSVLVGLKAEGKLLAETFLNSLRSVWFKLPPSDGINRNSNDEWMPRYPLHADDISLRVNKNRTQARLG